ncbi:MAG: glycosyltransferase family 4 protein [Ruminococcaceae bacterium]|nr:glycosyltransferase family 4 protein [Oscillospiraceae bacterium]
MNILYIAYSCSPYHGSEDKIGWSLPMESAKTNNVFVITKEEQRTYIAQYFQSNPGGNIRFYYVDIPNVFKKLFKGPLYSGRLNIWNRRAQQVAKEICEKEGIDVIHQIAPVEFRSIGAYGKIPGVKFVCGPMGGGEYIPKGLRPYAKGHGLVEIVRALANAWYKCKLGLAGTFRRCDKLLFSNRETRSYLRQHLPKVQHPKIMTEIGIDITEISENPRKAPGEKRRFLVAGRLVYRKGHALLLDALEQLPEEMDYECRIVGDGPEYETIKNRCQSSEKLSKHVVLTGAIPYARMVEEYDRADVFVMPSLRETTGTVLLEAMSKGIPVITVGRFGGAVLLDEHTGWHYDGNSRQDYVANLKKAVTECIQNPEEISRRGENARKKAENYTWQRKMVYFQELYNEVSVTGED